jgi:hypothetical protein
MAKQIETIKIDLTRKTTKRLVEEVGKDIVPIRAEYGGRNYQRKNLALAGRTTKLTMTQYLEKVFFKNELLGCQGIPLTNPQIEHNLMQEFPNQKFRYIKNHHTPIGLFRNRYMARKLFSNQAIPLFVSLRYDDQGYIVQSANANRYMSFHECRALCEDKHIADPRFFTFEEIQAIAIANNKTQNEWYYPDAEEWNYIKTQLKRNPYNSLRFPDGLGKV